MGRIRNRPDAIRWCRWVAIADDLGGVVSWRTCRKGDGRSDRVGYRELSIGLETRL